MRIVWGYHTYELEICMETTGSHKHFVLRHDCAHHSGFLDMSNMHNVCENLISDWLNLSDLK
jgi:hypothetical protein